MKTFLVLILATLLLGALRAATRFGEGECMNSALSAMVSFLALAPPAAPLAAAGKGRIVERAHEDREIWLGPQSLPPKPLAQDADFMDLFQPNAPWEVAASHTGVFKLYASFLAHASQEQVNAIVSDLNRRGIVIALEIGVMNVNFTPPPPCGGLGIVEGYGTPSWPVASPS